MGLIRFMMRLMKERPCRGIEQVLETVSLTEVRGAKFKMTEN